VIDTDYGAAMTMQDDCNLLLLPENEDDGDLMTMDGMHNAVVMVVETNDYPPLLFLLLLLPKKIRQHVMTCCNNHRFHDPKMVEMVRHRLLLQMVY